MFLDKQNDPRGGTPRVVQQRCDVSRALAAVPIEVESGGLAADALLGVPPGPLTGGHLQVEEAGDEGVGTPPVLRVDPVERRGLGLDGRGADVEGRRVGRGLLVRAAVHVPLALGVHDVGGRGAVVRDEHDVGRGPLDEGRVTANVRIVHLLPVSFREAPLAKLPRGEKNSKKQTKSQDFDTKKLDESMDL